MAEKQEAKIAISWTTPLSIFSRIPIALAPNVPANPVAAMIANRGACTSWDKLAVAPQIMDPNTTSASMPGTPTCTSQIRLSD